MNRRGEKITSDESKVTSILLVLGSIVVMLPLLSAPKVRLANKCFSLLFKHYHAFLFIKELYKFS